MGLINWIKGVIGRMFKTEAKKAFGVQVLYSGKMENEILIWRNILTGKPYWKNKEDDIDTINFAKFITSDTAKKICLNIDINVSGSERADYLNVIMQELKKILRDKVEDACGFGGIMFKPNGADGKGDCINYIPQDEFLITNADSNGNIKGAIFFDHYHDENTGKHYRKMEYQRFEGDQYIITNKAYCSKNENELGKEVKLKDTPTWGNLMPEVSIDNVEDTLFAFYKMPYNNTIADTSPLGVSVFSNALKELKDLDVAWSRKSSEVEDSKHITFVDVTQAQLERTGKIKLPRFVRTLDMGQSGEENIHEHVATLLTEQRIADINSILSLISTKCGFSQGQFVLDRKTGNITATQVEADDRETIETIKDMRDALKNTMDHLIYALNVYADLYNLSPVGEYETSYGFGDLTYNWEEDRQRHWNYVLQGKYPLYRYYMKFEGMSEEEAKKVIKEAQGENNPDKDEQSFTAATPRGIRYSL